MINSVFLKNFKSFSDLAVANLGDLLVVAGPNSCGKTTLIQALLLLSQTLENARQDVTLDLGGTYVQFSEFRDVVFGRPSNAEARFTLGFNLEVLENDPLQLLVVSPLSGSSTIDRFIRSTPRRFQIRVSDELISKRSAVFSITFGATRNGKPIVQSLKFEKRIGEKLQISHEIEKSKGKNYTVITRSGPIGDWGSERTIDDLTITIERLIFQIKKQIENVPLESTNLRSNSISKLGPRLGIFIEKLFQFYGIVTEKNSGFLSLSKFDLHNIRLPVNKTWPAQLSMDIAALGQAIIDLASIQEIETISTLPMSFNHFIPSSSQSYVREADWKSEEYISSFLTVFGETVQEIRHFLRSFQYIGPLRAKPERAYLPTGTPPDIGKSGENAVPILWLEQSGKILTKTKPGQVPTWKRFDRAVQEWFEEFGIAHALHVSKPKRVIYQAALDGPRGSGIKVTIADVGFGVSQLLPVIVAGLRAAEGSTLIFEQPEIHLHPKLQAKLADFLICLVELNKRVIVETHSEHLINMLRLRIVEDSSGKLQDRIRILFVQTHSANESKNVKGSYISNLELDQYGQIINWPEDFFPEHGDLNEKILKAMMLKHSRDN